MQTVPRGEILVLCPLRLEARAIARGLRAEGLDAYCTVHQTGPGPKALTAALTRAHKGSKPQAVVLAGLAGGLAPVPDLPTIKHVITEQGERWVCTLAVLLSEESAPPHATLLARDRVVSSPSEKHALARSTGAHLVDTESHALARFCTESGTPWMVLRAVSDHHDDTLPAQASAWVDRRGNERPSRVALDLVRRPALLPGLLALSRRSGHALRLLSHHAAGVVRGLVERGPEIERTLCPPPGSRGFDTHNNH